MTFIGKTRQRRFYWLYRAFPENIQHTISGLSVISAILLFIAFLISHTIGLTGKLPTCYLLAKTGLQCPACGGTRATEALMHGEILESLKLHPIVLYGTVCTILFVIGEIISRITGRRPGIARARAVHFLIAIVIFGIHFTSQNFI